MTRYLFVRRFSNGQNLLGFSKIIKFVNYNMNYKIVTEHTTPTKAWKIKILLLLSLWRNRPTNPLFGVGQFASDFSLGCSFVEKMLHCGTQRHKIPTQIGMLLSVLYSHFRNGMILDLCSAWVNCLVESCQLVYSILFLNAFVLLPLPRPSFTHIQAMKDHYFTYFHLHCKTKVQHTCSTCSRTLL